MVIHFTQALTTSTPIRLGANAAAIGNPIRFLSIQAAPGNAAVVYVGGSQATLSSTNYGWLIPIPVSSIPAAPSIIELATASFGLGDIFVLGTTNDKVFVTAIGG